MSLNITGLSNIITWEELIDPEKRIFNRFNDGRGPLLILSTLSLDHDFTFVICYLCVIQFCCKDLSGGCIEKVINFFNQIQG